MIACSERVRLTEPDGNGGTPEFAISNFRFTPSTLTVPVGTAVRWRNTTSTFHTITPDNHAAWQERQTNSPGVVFEITFQTPGTYEFHCMPHQALGMTGRVVVE
jgi:plastocyanin